MQRFINSRFYTGRLWHFRKQGVKNNFSYPVFIWYLDLDEISASGEYDRLIASEKFGLFSFKEKDHGKFDTSDIPLREKIRKITRAHQLPDPMRIMLLTNLRTAGYVFNPVSFYYLFDQEQNLFAAIAEVNNTFGEQKAYLIPFQGSEGCHLTEKQFYVSPFIRHDSIFEFRLKRPAESLRVEVNTSNHKGFELKALLTGREYQITALRVWGLFLKFPLITLKIIFLIHYQALKLYLKKLPYYKKAETDLLIRAATTHKEN